MGVRPGYKQTEVGVIPEDWEVKSLHAISERIMVGIASAATHAYRDKGVVMFRNQNIKSGYLDDSDVLYIAEDYEQAFKNKRLKGGDLLTARTGYPGTTSIVPSQYEGAQSFTTLITRPYVDLVDPAYLCIFINSGAGHTYFDRNQIGGGQKNVNAGSLKHFPVALPPTMAEQQTIAKALSDADALIESLGQLLAKKRQIKQGAMQELLTGKKRLSGFTEEWDIKSIDELTECKAGGTPSTLVPEYWGGSIPWMNSGELNLKIVHQVDGRITDRGLQNSSTNIIPAKCVLIGLAGQGRTRGTVAMNMIPLCTNQSIAAIFPNTTFVPEYLFFNLDSRYEELRELSTGDGGRGGLNLTIIRSLGVPFPSLEEQKAIAAVLSGIDAELEALETKLDKVRLLKQGMMQELLTGRIRLVGPSIEVVPFTVKQNAGTGTTANHNLQINEAVVLAVLAHQFGSEQFPLGRFRRTKLSYLLHRHAERQVTGFMKKAAGPYSSHTRYGGAEKIALKNGYVRIHKAAKSEGFIAADNIAQAEAYFESWYGLKVLDWLKQFRYKRNDELELLTTVDMAIEDLRREGTSVTVPAVKRIIHDSPEWKAKLDRATFADSNITAAIESCHQLFPVEE